MTLHIKKILVILFAGLILGCIINQFHPNGVPLRLMMLDISGPPRSQAWTPISTDSAFALLVNRTALFLDIRTREDFRLDHIPGARSLPFHTIFRNPNAFQGTDNNRPVIIYDFPVHSDRAVAVVRLLKKRNTGRIYFLRGGFSGWLSLGFPAEKKD